MMFIRVALEALVSPNDLMLNAPSSSESERRSRARSRPMAHTKRILSQAGCTVQKHRLLFFMKLRKKDFFFSNKILNRLQIPSTNSVPGLWMPRLSLTLLWDWKTDATPGAWNTWAVAFPVCEVFYLAASQQLQISRVQLFLLFSLNINN